MQLPNVDTLFVNVDFQCYEERFKEVLQELSACKEKAKKQVEQYDSHGVHIEIQGLRFQVLPNGVRSFAYVLHGELMEINIARFRSKNQYTYPMRVRFKSECLWSVGVLDAWKFFVQWVSGISPILKTQVSRVDMCLHTDEIEFECGIMDHFKGSYVKDQTHRENRIITGYTFGSREAKIYTRIYNKSKELVNSHKDWFREIWAENGAVGDVWNIEFQLGREFLKETGVETMDDLLGSLGGLWHYLTEGHLTLTEFDRTRIERSTIHPVWIDISTAFDAFCGYSLIERKKVLNSEADSLIPQLSGVLTSYIARRLGSCDFEDAISDISQSIPGYFKNKWGTSFMDETQAKYALLQNICGGTAIIPGGATC